MVKIAFCDDNQQERERYAQLVSKLAVKHHIPIELSHFSSGETLLFHCAEIPTSIDILYLDIIMDKMNGIDTAQKLREYGCTAQIVFLTDFENHAYEAFDVNAMHYLLKSETNSIKFENVFLKAVEQATRKTNELFICEFDGETRVIPLSQISYFEIWKRVVTVHFGDGETTRFYGCMEHLEKRLNEKNFIRTHRSYLVNLAWISRFQTQTIQLKSGQTVPVGITYGQRLEKSFSNYLSQFNVCDIRDFHKKSK